MEISGVCQLDVLTGRICRRLVLTGIFPLFTILIMCVVWKDKYKNRRFSF